MYNHLWAVDKEGSYYTLKNGHTTEASYLQTPAKSTTGESVFTASSKGSTANWILEPYTGDPLQAANFTTYTSNMIVGEEFTFHARMYSSSIGVNGPVQYLVLNADGTATDKATINRSTGKIQALKPGEIRVGATFSGTTTYWYRPVTIEESLEGTCYFYNKQYEKYYMQIDDGASASEEGAIMELHMYNGGDDQKWILEYVSDGYYKIVSQTNGKVITAPNNLNNAVTLQLYSGADTQQWKFISVGDGTYHISPRFSPSSYLAASDGLDTELFIKGRNVELRTSQSDFKDEWDVLMFEWNSDSTNAGYWETNPTLYREKFDTSSYFYFNNGNNSAVDQWSNALDISFPSASEDEAKIKSYGATRSYFSTYMGKTFDTNTAGLTDYSWYTSDYETLNFDGSTKNIYCMAGATIYILSEGYDNETQMNIVVHEFGHALGCFGHSPDSTDVMYAYCQPQYVLTRRDIGQLKFFYYTFR